ncbi:O-antigen ligase family protein [Patescibacteria group bacterium]|nr:O-antigen ligase family protein [Patescibacteria group bacterium]
MAYGFLITIYLLLFTFITWQRFCFGLALFFFLLPTYLIRFHIGPIPTTLLEMMFLIIVFIALLKKETRNKIYPQGIPLRGQTNLKSQISNNRFLFFAVTLFLLSATISVFTSSNILKALGEWKAFYVEPFILFFILITTLKQDSKTTNRNIYALVLSGLITSILAIYQHFTGWMVPWDFWQNNETYRVTAWYGFPNAVGLFLAPIWPLALYLLRNKIQETRNKQISKNQKPKILKVGNWFLFVSCILYLAISPLAIFFAKSTGALIGLVAGIGILLLAYKKTRLTTIIILASGFLTLILLPQSNPIKQELLLQDRSGQIRLSMWSDTFEFLKDNPITGAGLASYQEKIIPYHTTVNGEGIEIFHHPHNIFLTMWVNLGLFGLIGFVLILIWFFKESLSFIIYHLSNNEGTIRKLNNLPIYLLSSLVIIIVMGLVDSPYIKNDLAIFFWLLPTLLLNVTQTFRFDKSKSHA